MTVVLQSWAQHRPRMMLADDIGVLWDGGVWLTEWTEEERYGIEYAEDWWMEIGQYI